MRKIHFITSNPHKVAEMQKKLMPLGYRVVQTHMHYPEIQADTLEEVAKYGAKWLLRRVVAPFILEDAGLFIKALNGFPGVYSKHVFLTIGNEGILKLMCGTEERDAEFRSVIALVEEKEVLLFIGKCMGEITYEARGSGGFGFDPIFVPQGQRRTFAEMSTTEKNAHSHRGRAVEKLIEHLKTR